MTFVVRAGPRYGVPWAPGIGGVAVLFTSVQANHGQLGHVTMATLYSCVVPLIGALLVGRVQLEGRCGLLMCVLHHPGQVEDGPHNLPSGNAH